MFSWPASSSFTILHVDLWMTCYHKDPYGYMALMNTMCDIRPLVAVVPIRDEISVTLLDRFMQYVLIKFGIYHFIVLVDRSSFKGAFIAMYEYLHLNYDVLAKRNDKGLMVENIH